METKPYRLQAPEDIAKEYGGNKQKIAEAMQIGLVDPTAGVLAGMFIDRMRSAQMQEMAAKPTVAQQVMGGVPQAPVPPSSGGLGAIPPAAPPMAPEMAMAPPMEAPMPEEAPVGMAAGGLYDAPYMAGGGLSDLPVPDGMFDENRNGGYSNGGIVAFAGAGEARVGGFGDYIEETVRRLDPNIQIAGRARTPARNAQVGGVTNSYHLIDAARDIRTPEGMSKSDFIAQLKSVFGPDYDVLPSKGSSVHVEPGPKLGERARAGARPSSAFSRTPERDIDTAEGRMLSADDSIALAQRYMKPSDKELEAEERYRARLEELGSDEYQDKMRKDSLWETLATIGFNMASSKAPSVLQAVGEAAAAAMPGARADKKERKALKDRALEGLIELGARDRQRANDAFKVGLDIYKTGLEAEQAEKLMDFRYKELESRENIATLDRNASLQAAAMRQANPDKFDIMFAAYRKSYPDFSDVAILKQMVADKVMGGGGQSMALPGMEEAGAGGGNSGMTILGSRPVQ